MQLKHEFHAKNSAVNKCKVENKFAEHFQTVWAFHYVKNKRVTTNELYCVAFPGGFITRTLIAGVIGCAILIPLFLFVLWMWKRQFKPLSGKL
jgi:hypothetical protein